ncbi:MAG: hypothetical protein JW797_02920 [Bradymonadales bacterium]|nr:hypothetical protein [Bradymonadales bacterium]
MNPIVEKLGDRPKEWLQKGNEFVNPFIQKLNDRRKEWFTRGSEMWTDLQERHAKFFEKSQAALDRGHAALDRGQEALEDAIEASQKRLTTFETTVLSKISSILEWAYTATGEKSEPIQRSREFISERLEELKKSQEESAEEKTESEPAEEEPEQEPAEAEAEEAAGDEAEAETEEPVDSSQPFEGYDSLTAKEVIEQLEGLSREQLESVRSYEESTKARKTVIEAVDKLMA